MAGKYGPDWQTVSYTVFKTFIKENNLTKRKGNGWEDQWENDKGELKAEESHGFASQIYEIKTEKNYESLDFITNKINSALP